MTLLLIDDDPAFSLVLRRALVRRGYDVHTAATPEQALETASAHDPDGIVLDLNLAGESGLMLSSVYGQGYRLDTVQGS